MKQGKVIGGFFWSTIETIFSQFLTFAAGIILARLLSPDEFGLIGMITIFISISQIFITGGLNEALIRKEIISKEDLDTAFFFNVVVSVLFYLILFIASGWISNYYNQPELKLIIKILSITIVINAFSQVQQVKIIKSIDFKQLAKVSLLASIISNLFGILLAVFGFGVWSLVYKTILQGIISAIYFWKINESVPQFRFNKVAFRDLFRFGGNLMALGLIDSIYSNVNYLIIGKYYSVATLGQYTRAEVFKQLPSQTLTQVVQKVSFPLLSEMQNDKQKLQFAYRRLIKTTMLISMIGLFLLSSISKELIIVLMGAQWEQAGEFLQILCFSAIFFPLDALNGNILKVFNRSDIILKIGVLRKVIAIPLFILLIKGYIIYFLYGLIFHQFVSFLLISNYSLKYINYGTWGQIKDLSHFLIISLLVYLVLFISSNYLEYSLLFSIVFKLSVGLLLSIAILEIIKDKTYKELKSMGLNFLK